MTRQEIIDFCLTLPYAYEDYPFDRPVAGAHTYLVSTGTKNCGSVSGQANNKACTVMRHGQNKKIFALVMKHGDELYLNLKCDPMEADFLRGAFESIIPGFHMNKRHWNTVIIGGDVPDDEIWRMVEESYSLIKPKRSGSPDRQNVHR